jgi:hypothetical protein
MALRQHSDMSVGPMTIARGRISDRAATSTGPEAHLAVRADFVANVRAEGRFRSTDKKAGRPTVPDAQKAAIKVPSEKQ